jgi:hypothetical protein
LKGVWLLQALFDLEATNQELKSDLRDLYITSAQEIDVGSSSRKAIIIHVSRGPPFLDMSRCTHKLVETCRRWALPVPCQKWRGWSAPSSGAHLFHRGTDEARILEVLSN